MSFPQQQCAPTITTTHFCAPPAFVRASAFMQLTDSNATIPSSGVLVKKQFFHSGLPPFFRKLEQNRRSLRVRPSAAFRFHGQEICKNARKSGGIYCRKQTDYWLCDSNGQTLVVSAEHFEFGLVHLLRRISHLVGAVMPNDAEKMGKVPAIFLSSRIQARGFITGVWFRDALSLPVGAYAGR